MNMKSSNIIVVGALVASALLVGLGILAISSAGSSQNVELTQMLMTIKADQERLLTQNEELLAFKKSLTEAICPKVEPVVQGPIVQPDAGPTAEAQTDAHAGEAEQPAIPEVVGQPEPTEQLHVHE